MGNCNAKLTVENVLKIRKSKKTLTELSFIFNVTKQNIKAIKDFKTWKHI